jgi:hypothetical protein
MSYEDIRYTYKHLVPIISIYILTSVIWYFLVTHLGLLVPKITLQASALNIVLHFSSWAFIYIGINVTLSKTYGWFVKLNQWTRRIKE